MAGAFSHFENSRLDRIPSVDRKRGKSLTRNSMTALTYVNRPRRSTIQGGDRPRRQAIAAYLFGRQCDPRDVGQLTVMALAEVIEPGRNDTGNQTLANPPTRDDVGMGRTRLGQMDRFFALEG
jgi:hypothetical protein